MIWDSDLSCYGGEIHTPNIDYLAEQGIRFSQFKNTGQAAPVIAALLLDIISTEQNGMDDRSRRTSSGIGDNFRIAHTLAEVRDQGYATYMSGKWHLLP